MLGKPEGKRQLERPRRRWENNIKMDVRKIGWGDMTGFIWLRKGPVRAIVSTVMNPRVP
jgi:hypothetical protein